MAAQDERAPLLSSSSGPDVPPSSSNASWEDPANNHWHSGNHHQSRRGSISRRTTARIVRTLSLILAVLVTALGIAIVLQTIASPEGLRGESKDRRRRAGRNYDAFLVKGARGAVATENGVCSEMGVEIMRKGGNAVDAGITSTLCIGLMNMFSSGIGGGGFMIVRNPAACDEKNTPDSLVYCAEHTTIDFRETAPALANETMYYEQPMAAMFGGLAVGVPGEVKGLEEAWNRWGSKKPGLVWKDLIEPVARVAEEGWPISKELDRRMQVMTQYFGPFLNRTPEWAEVFTNERTGKLKRVGDTMRRPSYGRTLREIGEKGSDVFYKGPMAETMASAAQRHGGVLQASDFAAYNVEVKPALSGDWLGRRVWTTQAPTSGPVLLLMLRILKRFPHFAWRSMDRDVLSAHHFIEAEKFSFGARTNIGDPAFLNETALAKVDLIANSDKEAHRLWKKIDDDRTHKLNYYEPLFDIKEDHGTMHLTIADRNGMAMALTSTVNLPFGSQVMDPVTGIILNDEMDDSSTPGVANAFGLRPSPYNYPEPYKRPLSSISPAIIEHPDGSFLLALGGSGGSRIYGSVLQTMLNLDWGYDLSDAIEHPRLHHQLLPQELSVETGYPQKILDGLSAKGHKYKWLDVNSAAAEVQAVMHVGVGRHAIFHAASDSRKQGVAAAF